MSDFIEFGILVGSEKTGFDGDVLGDTPEDYPLVVTLHLKRKLSLNFDNTILNQKFLSRQKLEDEHGAAYDDVKKVFAFAEHFGLKILQANMCSRTVVIAGSVAQISKAFKVKLKDSRQGSGVFRTRLGPIYLPCELLGVVTGVFGLDNRPQATPHFRLSQRLAPRLGLKPDAFDGNQLASIYNFPASSGEGQTIAIIELGGGYQDTDIASYFDALNLPFPVVKSVSVGGGANSPGIDPDADTEVALDIEVAGSVAPGATVVVYFAPNTSQGFLQAILAAVHDSVNKPSIISISWGSAEPSWTSNLMAAMEQAFQSAAALGITVLVAAGDDGANDNVNDGRAHVDFPASGSVTACGGTSLEVEGGVRQESVWNDGDGSATGGGISNVFARPPYQQNVPMPSNLNGTLEGRGVPDLAAVADPDTGYAVFVDGDWIVVGGTSAAAPLIAGLMARINQLTGKPSGLINTALYAAQSANGFNDIVGGNNSCDGVTGYSAVKGWDPVTGWGSPNGITLLKLLSS